VSLDLEHVEKDLSILPERIEQIGIEINWEYTNDWLPRLGIKIWMKDVFGVLLPRDHGI